MNFLSKNEEILLLAVWKLKGNAFGTSIYDEVEKSTDSKWLSGAIYGTLNRLKKNGYIRTVKTEQSPEQVGRPRIYYELTVSGLEKLTIAQKVSRSIWDGVADLEKAK